MNLPQLGLADFVNPPKVWELKKVKPSFVRNDMNTAPQSQEQREADMREAMKRLQKKVKS